METIEREEVTQEDIEIRLSREYSVLNKIVVGLYLSGWKVDHDVNMGGVICLGTLALGGAVIKGNLYVSEATIKGDLYLDSAEIEGDLTLSGISVEGNLELENAFIKGNLYLNGATIRGVIKIATKNGPKMIYVSQDMVELVHWAAPTIPLVVVR